MINRVSPEPVPVTPAKLAPFRAVSAVGTADAVIDDFSAKLNAMPKLVASRSLERAGEWQNSTVLQGDLAAEVRKRKQAQDIVVIGSASVVRTLMANDLVDEYRLLVFPLVLGEGTLLFPEGTGQANLALVSASPQGPAVRLVYEQKPLV
jgi:dihydrofolate reductase